MDVHSSIDLQLLDAGEGDLLTGGDLYAVSLFHLVCLWKLVPY